MHNSDIINSLLIFSSPLIIITSLSRIRQYITRAFKHVISAEVLDIVFRPLLIITLFLIYNFLSKEQITAYDAIIITIISTIISLAIGTYWLYKIIPHKIKFIKKIYKRSEWLSVSFTLMIITIMQIVTGYADTIMLGALSSYTESGIYSIALRISNFTSFSLIAINMMLAPLISELYFSNKRSTLQKNITFAARTSSLLALIIIFFLIFLGKKILNLFGPEFHIAYTPLLLLLPGQLMNCCCGSVGLILSLTGHHNFTVLILGITSILNLILNFILIPLYGMTGAAIATTISTSIWNILMAITVSKKLHLRSSIL